MSAPNYLTCLEVMYADHEYSQPDGIVTEIQGESSDMNKGFGNPFVWLRPHWSSDKDKAISDIDFHRSSEEIRNYNDLTTQSKTDFRYLLTRHDGDQKITKTGLFRTSESLSESDLKTRIGQSGYTNHSGDINKGRRGDYLYLVWAYD